MHVYFLKSKIYNCLPSGERMIICFVKNSKILSGFQNTSVLEGSECKERVQVLFVICLLTLDFAQNFPKGKTV